MQMTAVGGSVYATLNQRRLLGARAGEVLHHELLLAFVAIRIPVACLSIVVGYCRTTNSVVQKTDFVRFYVRVVIVYLAPLFRARIYKGLVFHFNCFLFIRPADYSYLLTFLSTEY